MPIYKNQGTKQSYFLDLYGFNTRLLALLYLLQWDGVLADVCHVGTQVFFERARSSPSAWWASGAVSEGGCGAGAQAQSSSFVAATAQAPRGRAGGREACCWPQRRVQLSGLERAGLRGTGERGGRRSPRLCLGRLDEGAFHRGGAGGEEPRRPGGMRRPLHVELRG